MSLSPVYLPLCYGLGAVYYLLLFLGGTPLTVRDVFVFMLSPLTLPLTAFMRLSGVLFNLDRVCFQRPL